MSKKARTAIVPTRDENFPEWYQQVIKAAGLAENSPVRGCMIIKPYGYSVWENMQRIFDGMIKEHDVENAYFPLLIPLEFIAREAEHIDGFAKECAVVTHHRLEDDGQGGLKPAGELEEPYVIRPTSETIIGDSMSRWIQSYRDLPMKLNQWANVMRWEMRTRLFLRTSEFLWQEGHNAFETADEARDDAHKMIKVYQEFAQDVLALPVIVGEKTEDERFPGANTTLTIEAMMQDGKALQAGTSHDLGQNFSKSCEIKFQNRDGGEDYAWTTSWGISTRLIGAMIMTHGDDDGMIMPPKIAPYQVGILPITKGDENDGDVLDYAYKLKAALKDIGVSARVDDSDARTPDKMWAMVKKGVPLRVEIGAREVAENQLTHVRRDLGRESKTTCAFGQFIGDAPGLLNAIHQELLDRARAFRDANIFDAGNLDDIEAHFKDKDAKGFARIDVAKIDDPKYAELKKRYSLTSRCMPLDDDGGKVLVGKAY